MSEGTISETPLFRPAFSTSSPFCRIPTRRETRKIQHPRELFSPYAFAPYHFIQQRRERFVSTPRPHQPFKPSSSGRGKNPSWEKSSFSGLFSILYFSFFLSLFQLVIRNFIDIQLNCWEGREKRKFHFKEE